jgi:hypothetical protein
VPARIRPAISVADKWPTPKNPTIIAGSSLRNLGVANGANLMNKDA